MARSGRQILGRAFNLGQEAWHHGRSLDGDNPYPPFSADYDAWRQGWEAEQEAHKDTHAKRP
jgi:ribosome modulation factor